MSFGIGYNQDKTLLYPLDSNTPILITFGLADSRVYLEAVKCHSMQEQIFASFAVACGWYVRLHSTIIIKKSQMTERLKINSDQIQDAIQANCLYPFLSEQAKKVSTEFQSKEWFRYTMHVSALGNNPPFPL